MKAAAWFMDRHRTSNPSASRRSLDLRKMWKRAQALIVVRCRCSGTGPKSMTGIKGQGAAGQCDPAALNGKPAVFWMGGRRSRCRQPTIWTPCIALERGTELTLANWSRRPALAPTRSEDRACCSTRIFIFGSYPSRWRVLWPGSAGTQGMGHHPGSRWRRCSFMPGGLSIPCVPQTQAKEPRQRDG